MGIDEATKRGIAAGEERKREAQLLDQLDEQLRLQQRQPDDARHAVECARIYVKLGDLENAVGLYRQALRLDEDHAEALLGLGLLMQTLGRQSEAEHALRAAVRCAPRDIHTHLSLAGLLERMQRFDEALDSVQSALSLDANHLEARLQLVRLYIQRQELDKARELLEPLSENQAAHSEVWNLLGLMHARANEPAQARTCYQKALDIDPQQAETWTHLGNVLVQLDEDKGAEHAYRTAVEQETQNADFWFNLGEFYFQRSNYQAEHALMQTVRLNKEDMEAWELLNQWYKERASPSRRRMALRMLVSRQPQREDLLRDLAILHEQLGELNEARQVLNRLEQLTPKDSAIRQQAARVLLKQGQVNEVYTRLRDLDASESVVHDLLVHLGQRLMFRKQFEQAEECLLRAAKARPNSPQLWQMLAELAMQRQDHQETFARLCKAGELNRNQASLWLPLAKHFIADNHGKKAETCYECLSELICHRADLWPEVLQAARLASTEKENEWLGRLQQWLELEQAHPQHWETLADLYQQAHQPERAQACHHNLQAFLQKQAQKATNRLDEADDLQFDSSLEAMTAETTHPLSSNPEKTAQTTPDNQAAQLAAEIAADVDSTVLPSADTQLDPPSEDKN